MTEIGIAPTATEISIPLPFVDSIGSIVADVTSVRGHHGNNRISGTVTLGGRPVLAEILLIESNTRLLVTSTVTDMDTGYYEFDFLDTNNSAGFDVIALNRTVNSSYPIYSSAVVGPVFSGGDATCNIRMGEPIPGRFTSALSGNCSAGAVLPDEVVAFDWTTLTVLGIAAPSPTGDWTIPAPPGVYGVIYRKVGCQPSTHGPYTVT